MEFESSPAIYISLRPKMVKPLWGEKNDTEPHSGDMKNTQIFVPVYSIFNPKLNHIENKILMDLASGF